MTEPNLHLSGRQGITDSAASDAADVGKTLIQGIAPAERGWILGFVVVVLIIVASYTWMTVRTAQYNATASQRLTDYLISVEDNRSEALSRQAQYFSDQVRRSQEVIKELTQAVSRDSERAGMAAMSAIDERARAVYSESNGADFIGPPMVGEDQ